MTAFALKLIAVISMLIDHTGILLFDRHLIARDLYLWMRIAGRFAFPIYSFLLAEGFRHLRADRERLLKHLLMLVTLAAFSEFPFDWLFHGKIHYTDNQSVMFTLLFAFLALMLSEQFRDRLLPRFGCWVMAMALAASINTDYGASGVLLVFLCSLYLERFEDWGYGRRLLGALGVILGYYSFYMWVSSGFGSPAAAWKHFLAMSRYFAPHLILIPLLAAYDGERGLRNRFLHRCYQWFYPAHLTVLCGIAYLLGRQ